MFKVLLFDLDGTLTDSREGITKSIAYALEKMGVNVPDYEYLLRYIGPPLVDSFSDYFESKEDINQAVLYYRERYSVVGWGENKVYDGIVEVLKKLNEAGFVICMATSKPEIYAEKIAEKFGFKEYIHHLCGALMDETRNRKSQVVEYALSQAGVKFVDGKVADSDEVLMIGDRYHDVEGAAVYGVKTLGVSYGFGTREELLNAGAIDVVDSPEGIVSYLTK